LECSCARCFIKPGIVMIVMKYLFYVFFILLLFAAEGFADCNCDDWVNRHGYCVDYVKSRVPSFPVPSSYSEIAELKNRDVRKIAAGDVAIFFTGNFWHVAYVEKVRLDRDGNPAAIDISEMNFGGQPRYSEYAARWKVRNREEWLRAVNCGITRNYARIDLRRRVPLRQVRQVWSPAEPVAKPGAGGGVQLGLLLGKVKDDLGQFCGELKYRCEERLHSIVQRLMERIHMT